MGFAFGAAFAAFLAAGAAPATAPSPDAAAQIVPAVPLISPVALKALYASGEKFLLVDVRESDEFAAGHIDGARLMPLKLLLADYARLPRNTRLVVYCRSGKRSARAVSHLLANGYNAVSLDGGYLAWTAQSH